MKKILDRREFLKLAGTLSLGAFAPKYLLNPYLEKRTVKKNILIVVFDAFSAYHLSLYGYPRETMPNLSRLAQRAVVYHNHYAAGNYTTPGTASLLTGLLPWTHRAFSHNAQVANQFRKKTLFNALPDYHRIVYSHNKYVNTFFQQFKDDIDEFIPRKQLYLEDSRLASLFLDDEDISTIGVIRSLNQKEDGYSYSLILSRINLMIQKIRENHISEYRKRFPRGVPTITRVESYYLLEDSVDFMIDRLAKIPNPYLGYFHFLPPHDPYNTRIDFFNVFANDGYLIPDKPMHIFSQSGTQEELNRLNTHYDEYLLYVDAEFGRLFDSLEQSGILEDTWLILTSDHGELFERGIGGHSTELLTEPIMRVPLLIFEPGRESRLDVFENTSAIDILPTLSKITGQEVPEWAEGIVLPPYSEYQQKSRQEIFAAHSNVTNDKEPIEMGSFMMVRDNYKLVYFFGYGKLGESGELIELYDLEADPDELNNLYPSKKSIAEEMLVVLRAKIAEADKPYI